VKILQIDIIEFRMKRVKNVIIILYLMSVRMNTRFDWNLIEFVRDYKFDKLKRVIYNSDNSCQRRLINGRKIKTNY